MLIAYFPKIINSNDTVEAVFNISQKYKIDMPIMESVYNILYKRYDLKDELIKLLNRSLKEEVI